MKNKDLQKILKAFPPNLEVTVTDGHRGLCYHTKTPMEIALFQETKGAKRVIDIGIGGCEEHPKGT
jgi:hypothetical protein